MAASKENLHPYRTHSCGELRPEAAGESVRLSGWIANKRDHGGVLFIDLRDRHGVTQIVAGSPEIAETLSSLPKETVVRIDGIVELRPDEMRNEKLSTGSIEVSASECEVLGSCAPLPFSISAADHSESSEELRLRYRYLDLRSDRLHRNILLRSQIISSLRRRMEDQGFTELQTPILTSSSPEGARDFLVPSRRHAGRFYALPQAPQQFKQLLMVAGFDRYFQIAPCFRDEDARADRSPGEFYQLDLEMSFATQEDVFEVIEDVLAGVFNEFASKPEITIPFERLRYDDAILRFGTDKPDLRIPIEIVDLSELFQNSGLRAFAGKVVRALRVPGGTSLSRTWFDRKEDATKAMGGKGMAWLTHAELGELKGPIAKFLSEEEVKGIIAGAGLGQGDAVVFVADEDASLVAHCLGQLRSAFGEELELIDDSRFRFCWITDFPMFERDRDTNRIEFSHNPFSMPEGGMEALETKRPEDVRALQYDLVCDGYELSSGAVRNHDPEVMYKAFEIAGYDRTVVDEKFPALQKALRYGAPPHAGFAPGIDRIVMLISGETNIRQVIAFPMNQGAQDLMMNAPSPVSREQLRDANIRTIEPARTDSRQPASETGRGR